MMILFFATIVLCDDASALAPFGNITKGRLCFVTYIMVLEFVIQMDSSCSRLAVLGIMHDQLEK